MNTRYTRHIQLPEIGTIGQDKLAKAKVLVVGAGGLGCPILQYLAAAGVGNLGIVDFDKVEKTNLHRQILFNEHDIDKNKAICAKEKLENLNSEITIEAFPVKFSSENCLELVENYDIIVDGTDNFTARYLINDACVLLKKPLVYGALFKFEGQVAVFNHENGPTYRCLFPIPPKSFEVPDCNSTGVIGVLPGIIGILQATEVLKIILNLGEILSGKILFFNLLTYNQRIISFRKNEEEINKIKNLSRPVAIKILDDSIPLAEIETKNCKFIDVREANEWPILEAENIIQIPLNELITNIHHLNFEGKKIFFCQTGIRSLQAKKIAESNGILDVYSLKEGAIELEKWL